MARIVFMGSPRFAEPALLALAEHHQIAGVVTQPDRRAGRGQAASMPTVKQAAIARGFEVLQPERLRSPEALERLATWLPDLIVVAAYGQILPASLLALPPHGCLNVHASLLPRHRGAAPIPAAILAGDPVTGVTIMLMDEGTDTGPLLAQAEWPIAPEATTESLTLELADLGARLLTETLPGWLAGTVKASPQDETRATHCRQLEKADGLLAWSRTAVELDRQVRACYPWPGAYTPWRGQSLKILRAQPVPDRTGTGEAGQVVRFDRGIAVATGHGLLQLLQVQWAGRRPMDADEFARGQRGLIGASLGTP